MLTLLLAAVLCVEPIPTPIPFTLFSAADLPPDCDGAPTTISVGDPDFLFWFPDADLGDGCPTDIAAVLREHGGRVSRGGRILSGSLGLSGLAVAYNLDTIAWCTECPSRWTADFGDASYCNTDRHVTKDELVLSIDWPSGCRRLPAWFACYDHSGKEVYRATRSDGWTETDGRR